MDNKKDKKKLDLFIPLIDDEFFCAYVNVGTIFNRSALKRLYQDRDQSSSPPNKQARRDDTQRGGLKNTKEQMITSFLCFYCCLMLNLLFLVLVQFSCT